MSFPERCPDCYVDGGLGKQCRKHELAMIRYKINCLKQREQELLKTRSFEERKENA